MGRRVEDMDRPALVALIMDHYATRKLKTQRRFNRVLSRRTVEELRKILKDIHDEKILPENFE